jgi:hypothetical protein
MRQVWQRSEADCSVACVAMISGCTYDKALAAVNKAFLPRKPRSLLTERKHLAEALRLLGVKAPGNLVPLRGRRLEDLDHDAIVKVSKGPKDSFWHWVVWDVREGKRDPDRSVVLRNGAQDRFSELLGSPDLAATCN